MKDKNVEKRLRNVKDTMENTNKLLRDIHTTLVCISISLTIILGITIVNLLNSLLWNQWRY